MGTDEVEGGWDEVQRTWQVHRTEMGQRRMDQVRSRFMASCRDSSLTLPGLAAVTEAWLPFRSMC
jgi:hypothetical protein